MLKRNYPLLRPSAGRSTKLLLKVALLLISFAAFAQQPATRPLLADTHKAAGLDCLQCHKEKPGTPVETATCKSCHTDIEKGEKAKSGLPNPHDAHMPFPDCAQCHHIHKTSENQCDNCHSFGFKIP